MSFSKKFQQRVQKKVHMARSDLYTIKLYPKEDIENWKNLTPEQKEKSLKKLWRIVWWYRHPKTHAMVRQNDIKAGANRYKTKTERLSHLKEYVKAMKEVLDEGYNPFTYAEYDEKPTFNTAEKAIDEALEVKKKTVSPDTYNEYKMRCDEFKRFLKKRKRLQHDIKLISRKVVTEYLDMVLKRSSARNRNHAMNALSAVFTTMSDSFVIESNFIKNDIPKLRVRKKVDRRFKAEELKQLSAYLSKNDPIMLLFLKMVGYNFMRPIEVARVKVGDIDLKKQEIYFDQKTKLGKIKQIPDIYFDELKNAIKGYDVACSVFAPSREPEIWESTDRNKRDYWSKQFKKVKAATGINTDMYGLRHFYITETYLVLRKEQGLTKNEAIEKLMSISGHNSKEGIEKYIHDYDLERPEDWSHLFKVKL